MPMSKKFHVPTGDTVLVRGNMNGGRVSIQRADGSREIVPGGELQRFPRKNTSQRERLERERLERELAGIQAIAAAHQAIKRPVEIARPVPKPVRKVYPRPTPRPTQCGCCGRLIVRGVRAKDGWECGACAASQKAGA